MSWKSQRTTGLNVDIPPTTESNQGEPAHESTHNGTDVASAAGTNKLNSPANRCLCSSRPAGAPDEQHPAAFQAQYSGQPRLRHRCAAGTALPGAARTVRGIPGFGTMHVDRRREDIRGSGGALQ